MGYKQKADTIIGKAGMARPQWDKMANSSNILWKGKGKSRTQAWLLQQRTQKSSGISGTPESIP